MREARRCGRSNVAATRAWVAHFRVLHGRLTCCARSAASSSGDSTVCSSSAFATPFGIHAIAEIMMCPASSGGFGVPACAARYCQRRQENAFPSCRSLYLRRPIMYISQEAGSGLLWRRCCCVARSCSRVLAGGGPRGTQESRSWTATKPPTSLLQLYRFQGLQICTRNEGGS